MDEREKQIENSYRNLEEMKNALFLAFHQMSGAGSTGGDRGCASASGAAGIETQRAPGGQRGPGSSQRVKKGAGFVCQFAGGSQNRTQHARAAARAP